MSTCLEGSCAATPHGGKLPQISSSWIWECLGGTTGGSRLAIDTTLVSAVQGDGEPTSLADARSRRTQNLSVLGLEVGGRWSKEARVFVQLLARARARLESPVIQRRMEQAWRLRRAFAASLLELRGGPSHEVERDHHHALLCGWCAWCVMGCDIHRHPHPPQSSTRFADSQLPFDGFSESFLVRCSSICLQALNISQTTMPNRNNTATFHSFFCTQHSEIPFVSDEVRKYDDSMLCSHRICQIPTIRQCYQLADFWRFEKLSWSLYACKSRNFGRFFSMPLSSCDVFMDVGISSRCSLILQPFRKIMQTVSKWDSWKLVHFQCIRAPCRPYLMTKRRAQSRRNQRREHVLVLLRSFTFPLTVTTIWEFLDLWRLASSFDLQSPLSNMKLQKRSWNLASVRSENIFQVFVKWLKSFPPYWT